MSDAEQEKLTRLQEVFTALLQHQLAQSLQRVEESLRHWRQGEIGVFEAHTEVLKHAARTERMAGRLANAGPLGTSSVLRDAFDAKLIEREEFVALTGKQPEDVEPMAVTARDGAAAAPPKREFLNSLLSSGPVLLHIDARTSGVSVPAHLKQDPKLVLRFGYNLTPVIHDLEINDQHVAGTLTFGGVPHHCVLPWSAIYAVVSESDERAMVWHEDVPDVVLAQMMQAQSSAEERRESTAPEAAKSAKRRANHLKLVD